MHPDKSQLIKWIAVCFCVSLVALGGLLYRHQKKSSLRNEVSKMQNHTSSYLSQVSDNKIYVVDIASRSLKEERQFISKGTANFGTLSLDGKEIALSYCSEPGFTHPSPYETDCPAGNLHLGLMQLESASFREFFDWTSPYGMCWSHDKSKLVLAARDMSLERPDGHRLVVLDMNSGTMRQIAGENNSTSTECWSHDDKKLVFTENKVGGIQNILIFDLEEGKTKHLAKGSGASWSPDGDLIAFSADPYSYSVIRPDGTGERKLFKTTVADSELWWSPDSQYVAYVSAKGFFERWPHEQLIELRRLRIRRLRDGAEDWLLNLDTSDPTEFQWVTPKS